MLILITLHVLQLFFRSRNRSFLISFPAFTLQMVENQWLFRLMEVISISTVAISRQSIHFHDQFLYQAFLKLSLQNSIMLTLMSADASMLADNSKKIRTAPYTFFVSITFLNCFHSKPIFFLHPLVKMCGYDGLNKQYICITPMLTNSQRVSSEQQ